ncbi:MAG: methylmalonate-semialdehyde dehydrogenase (acylating) [Elusimicrobia bacterium RIFOXYB2_FULL_49_7]|nr:MAG: methylmalonate-semialdehyde dehydrogenase (acylating) [Elusimicrobia bacterium RIFOXYB2_FULL_49_7]
MEWMAVTNPSTGEVIAETPAATADEVNDAIAAAKKAFPGWADTPLPDRIRVLFRYKALIETHFEALALLLSTEMGKVLTESKKELHKTIEAIEGACALAPFLSGNTLMNAADGMDTLSYREPLGVFSGIAPFNFPAMIPMGWLVPYAIATGNTFVLKAASRVPQTAMQLLKLLQDAGLPKGVVNLVTCGKNEAVLFSTHPDIRGVAFVGSTRIGRQVYQTAASHNKRVQALTEAKNHALILRDCVLEKCVADFFKATYSCAGQRCMAMPVAVVEEGIADDFCEKLITRAQRMRVGPATDKLSELGPVVSNQRLKIVLEWIEKGISQGAKLVLDGRSVSVSGFEKGFFVGPTIFDDVTPGMSVGDEEIFGPVTCIKRVSSFEEGLTLMNRNHFGKSSVIYTQSGRLAREFVRRTESGMVGVNVGIPSPHSLFPFCGHKDSFFGDLHTLGRDGAAFFTETKSVTSTWF